MVLYWQDDIFVLRQHLCFETSLRFLFQLQFIYVTIYKTFSQNKINLNCFDNFRVGNAIQKSSYSGAAFFLGNKTGTQRAPSYTCRIFVGSLCCLDESPDMFIYIQKPKPASVYTNHAWNAFFACLVMQHYWVHDCLWNFFETMV